MDGKREREFLPYQLSRPVLPDYPEGHWSRDWKNAAVSTGFVPARWGWLRVECKRTNKLTKEIRGKNKHYKN